MSTNWQVFSVGKIKPKTFFTWSGSLASTYYTSYVFSQPIPTSNAVVTPGSGTKYYNDHNEASGSDYFNQAVVMANECTYIYGDPCKVKRIDQAGTATEYIVTGLGANESIGNIRSWNYNDSISICAVDLSRVIVITDDTNSGNAYRAYLINFDTQSQTLLGGSAFFSNTNGTYLGMVRVDNKVYIFYSIYFGGSDGIYYKIYDIDAQTLSGQNSFSVGANKGCSTVSTTFIEGKIVMAGRQDASDNYNRWVGVLDTSNNSASEYSWSEGAPNNKVSALLQVVPDYANHRAILLDIVYTTTCTQAFDDHTYTINLSNANVSLLQSYTHSCLSSSTERAKMLHFSPDHVYLEFTISRTIKDAITNTDVGTLPDHGSLVLNTNTNYSVMMDSSQRYYYAPWSLSGDTTSLKRIIVGGSNVIEVLHSVSGCNNIWQYMGGPCIGYGQGVPTYADWHNLYWEGS